MSDDDDRRLLHEAVMLSRNAPPSRTAFSAGAVIAAADGTILGTGFSRERGHTSHAEHVAIEKAQEGGADLRASTLYASVEPCSVRLSGLPSCTLRILEAEIPRVVFAMREPPVFVEGRGAEMLAAAGVDVVQLSEEAPVVAEINRHLLRNA
ncbi:MAG TPA: deaminase [Candidatus Acidoferrales bacterium]|nr:deaminase [Candidatus Acidoferrales bacterium]